MRLALIKDALEQTYSDVLRNRTMQMAAGFSARSGRRPEVSRPPSKR